MGFLSGIFSSKQTRQDVYRDVAPVESSDEDLTGVAKYINAQSDNPVERHGYSKKLSGVAEYINTRSATTIELTDAEKDVINARINATIELRKTEESLMSAENEELSGVARYVESQEQACLAAQEEELAVTGVAKYLSNIVANKPATTGVAKYLKNRVEATVSSVDRYVINKSLADKNKPEVVVVEPSSVTKYLENKPTRLTSSVAKYIAKQGVAARQTAALTPA
ncbi:hypothetical protein bplSymb_SCF00608P008 [Bathymodiolus platifrons methanotrophic gill symbiont]|uniref:hypothetical protein n=1 Tax=Bathymodiolus platifrons methanotrophic gill symbiont TaxID=113268 RepID=UPI000B40D082|nr:hypothetical protein [Bathymodiolus platifrons methanotrophic gill symbiont]MCK5869272.1 hypothetical protein [Methyloprofundus sp.]TXK98421.1 hypothetical protein BMR10_02795 [Methylococcaceae bacterium CS4]TXL00980.1 hypothetical protein BMR11_01480 [Methylococcaceae bacterium CS5]TXL07043.1 hypothetical protein BMR07_05815 [Methylococcaceae bacterium CS1]TXL08326.1 hypothetical protein BMR09_03430 [Methylococcaceae bacterium CS3]TXL11103.1 hypothetical protein BMR08_06060 [Methylococcac